MKTKSLKLKWGTLVMVVALAQNCSALNQGFDASDEGEGNGSESGFTASVQAVGTENESCKLLSAKSNVLARSQNGPMSFIITASSNLSDDAGVATEGFSLSKDGSTIDFQINPAADTEDTIVTAQIHNSALQVGLHNLDTVSEKSDYVLTIPAGALSCEDGSQTSAAYTVSFEMTPCTLTPLCWDQSQANPDVPANGCGIRQVDGLTTASGMDDFSELTLEITLTDEDDNAALAVIDEDKIVIADASSDIAVQITPNEDLPSDYTLLSVIPDAELEAGDYSLQILPGAFECVDGSVNEDTYNIDFTLNRL